MVGVRTVNRCDNCRKRKKKCGQQKPSCLECIRSGWACPGYRTQLKFVDETRRVTEHYAAKEYIFDTSDLLDSEETCSKYSDEDMRRGMVVWQSGVSQNSSHQDYITNQRHALSGVPRYHETNRPGSALIFCLNTKVRGALVPLRMVGSFFEFIPARLGHNRALDDAVSCLSTIYCSSPSIMHSDKQNICKAYVRALSSLRNCLSDNALRMEADTLCASIILQICELVLNVDRGKWSHLARGTSYLLCSRGVHRYTSAFELAMFESQLPFILGQSSVFKESCFLSNPEWQTLLGQSPVWPFQTTESRSLSLRSRLCSTIVELPSLVMHCSKINEQVCVTENDKFLDLLFYRALVMFRDVKEFLLYDAEPLFLSHRSGSEQVVQERIEYPDILAGVLDCVANTALVSLDKILRLLFQAKLRPSSLVRHDDGYKSLYNTEHLDSLDVVERRRQRATKAFEFVQGESTLAAKPLEFGVRQIQSNGCGYFTT